MLDDQPVGGTRFPSGKTMVMLSKVIIRTPFAAMHYVFGFSLIILASYFLGCGKETVNDRGGEKMMPSKTIEEVLKSHTEELMSIEGVVGTAIGECEGRACIKVYVVKKTGELEKKIPSHLEGYTVSVQETGEFNAL